jgi:hypothetical protein
VTAGKHPDGVSAPVQYGERIAAVVVYPELPTYHYCKSAEVWEKLPGTV